MPLFYYFWLQRVFIEVLWAYGKGMEDPSSPTRDQTLSPPLDVVSESHSVMSDSCDPMDWSPQGSFVHGILQARILEWVAISSSRGSSQPKDPAHISCVCCTDRWILCHCTAWEARVCLHCSLNNSGKYKEESKSYLKRKPLLAFYWISSHTI